jgi:hypothetical protein
MLKERGFKRVDVDIVGYNLCMRAWRVPPKNLPLLGKPPKNGHKNGHKVVTRAKARSNLDYKEEAFLARAMKIASKTHNMGKKK